MTESIFGARMNTLVFHLKIETVGIAPAPARTSNAGPLRGIVLAPVFISVR